METKTLPKVFTKKASWFVELKRVDDCALYHRVFREKPRTDSFEVVEIQKHGEYEIAGNVIAGGEALPGDEQFGSKGWSYNNLLMAEKRFYALLKKKGHETEIPEYITGKDIEEFFPVSSEEEEKYTAPKITRKRIDWSKIKIPDGEFTIKDLADLNGLNQASANQFIKKKMGYEIEFVRKERRAKRGKPTSIYQKIA